MSTLCMQHVAQACDPRVDGDGPGEWVGSLRQMCAVCGARRNRDAAWLPWGPWYQEATTTTTGVAVATPRLGVATTTSGPAVPLFPQNKGSDNGNS